MICLGFLTASWYDSLTLMDVFLKCLHFFLSLSLPHSQTLVMFIEHDYSRLIQSFSSCCAYSVRVSNELGRGNAKAAIFSVKVIVSNSLAIGIVFWALFLAFGHEISQLFTSNEEVAKAMSSLSVLLAFSFLLNSVQPVLIGSCKLSCSY